MAIGRVTKRDGARRRIVVVGAGFSGVAVAAQLLRRGARVTLIERGAHWGPGVAYGPAARGGHLLNTPAARMSALQNAPEDFVAWLRKRGAGVDGAGFAPRRLYGAYLEHVLGRAGGGLFSRLTRVRDAAMACRPDGAGGWRVTLASGRTIGADAVVLAPGHSPLTAPAPFETADMIGPWDQRALERLPRGRDVLLLGTGLTMADVAIGLSQTSRKGVIYALSRRGRLPQTHAPSAGQGVGDLALELSDALHQFRKQAGADWRAALDALRPSTPALWARLGAVRQARFLRHLRPWWDSFRHRAPPEIGARLAALIAEGRVRILAGEIVEARRESGAWRLQHRPRGTRTTQRLDVAGVVNCTGADHNVSRWDDPLIRQLLAEGLARGPENGLGFDVDEGNLLRDRGGASQAGLFLLGPLAIGAFWETTAAPELRARADAIAGSVLGD